MEEKLSYLSVAPHLKRLRFTGFYPISIDSPKLHRIFHTVYMYSALAVTPIYVLQQIIKIYQVRDDPNKVMDTMFLLLTNSDAIYKSFVFCMKSNQIDMLINMMNGPIFNQGVQDHEPILSQTVRFSQMFLRAFNMAAISTCLLWVLYPMILFIQNRPVEFTIWLPFDASKSPNFYIAIMYIWLQTTWLAINNTTMDAFISFFLAQSKTQLHILRMDLESLVESCKQEAKCSSIPYPEALQRRFRKILLHYNEITNFTHNLQRIFSGPLFYQFMVSGWIICTTAYRTVKIDPASVEFASMILYMCCIIAELFLFCHFGHEVNWESALVLDSAYIADWLQFPLKFRKDLIIFTERLKRPLAPTAGSFIPLSNNTFISVMRSSYSFYVLLKTTD